MINHIQIIPSISTDLYTTTIVFAINWHTHTHTIINKMQVHYKHTLNTFQFNFNSIINYQLFTIFMRLFSMPNFIIGQQIILFRRIEHVTNIIFAKYFSVTSTARTPYISNVLYFKFIAKFKMYIIWYHLSIYTHRSIETRRREIQRAYHAIIRNRCIPHADHWWTFTCNVHQSLQLRS